MNFLSNKFKLIKKKSNLNKFLKINWFLEKVTNKSIKKILIFYKIRTQSRSIKKWKVIKDKK